MAVINIDVGNIFLPYHIVRSDVEIALVSYGTLDRANRYFDSRLRNRPWVDSTIDERRAALREATELIDKLSFIGQKAALNQLMEFPRGRDTVVPVDIEKACYEIAIKLLDGYDPDMEVETLADTSQGYSSVRSTYDRSFVLPHLRAGIPSSKAWELLKPYLADTRQLKIRRVD